MKTATLELYEFVEQRIKVIEETIEKKGQSHTLAGELIAYNEMKEEIVRVAKEVDEPNLIKSFKKGESNILLKYGALSKNWFNKSFKTVPTP